MACVVCTLFAYIVSSPARAQSQADDRGSLDQWVPPAAPVVTPSPDTTAGTVLEEEDLPDVQTDAAESPVFVESGDSTRAARWRALREKKARTMEPPKPSLAARVISFFERNRSLVLSDRLVLDIPNTELFGIQPVLGGLQGEAGLTAGLYYPLPVLNGPGRHSHVQVLGSLRRYWGTELIGGLEHGPWIGYGFARYSHRASESFYGIGPNTEVENRSLYQYDQGIVGGLAGYSIGDRMLVGGHLSYSVDQVGPGLDDSAPDVSTAFWEAPPPGVRMATDYGIGGIFAEYDSRNASFNRTYGRRFAPTEARLRGISLDATDGYYMSASLTHHQDLSMREYSYSRLTLDAQQYFTLEHGMQRGLAFRQFLSITESPNGQTIPFYRMQSIGGSTSLRGFTGGRFRDRNVMLSTAEVRCRIWHRLDMALFTDVGQVFSRTEEIRLQDMKVGYGVGFRFRSSQGVVARFEIARSVEGFSTYLKFGSIL